MSSREWWCSNSSTARGPSSGENRITSRPDTSDWYRAWFNDDYLALYPHRDEADADRLVQLITRVTGWGAGWRVADVGCGPGRHAALVERSGVSYVGLDLSAALLRRARAVTRAPLVRGDMRHLPFRARSFSAVLSLFTSFGYFEDDAEHDATLRGMVGALAPGGWLVLDFLNASHVRATLAGAPSEPVAAPAGATVLKRLSSDGRFVVKDITLASGARHVERVRLLSATDLTAMVARAGLVVRALLGDYDGAPHDPGTPRALLLAQHP
jgi:SAM-dependent methyltransferase